MKTSLIFLFALLLACPVRAGFIDQSEKLLREGKSDEAVKTLQAQLAQSPDNAHILYDLGVSCYASGRFQEAIGYWRKAATSSFGLLADKASAQIGNAQYRLGQEHFKSSPAAAASAWEEAVQNYEASLRHNPTQPLAANNLPLVRQQTVTLLEKLAREQLKNGKVGVEATPEQLLQRAETLGLALHYIARAAAVAPNRHDLQEQKKNLENNLSNTLLERATKLARAGAGDQKPLAEAENDFRQSLTTLDRLAATTKDQEPTHENQPIRQKAENLEKEVRAKLAENLAEQALKNAADSEAILAENDQFQKDLAKAKGKERQQLEKQPSPLERAEQAIAAGKSQTAEADQLAKENSAGKKKVEAAKKALSAAAEALGDKRKALASDPDGKNQSPEKRSKPLTPEQAEKVAKATADYKSAIALDPENRSAGEKSRALEREMSQRAEAEAEKLAADAQALLAAASTMEARRLAFEAKQAAQQAADRGNETPPENAGGKPSSPGSSEAPSPAAPSMNALAREQADQGGFHSTDEREMTQRANQKLAEAEATMQKALQFNPANEQMQQKRQMLQAKQGNLQQRLDASREEGRYATAEPAPEMPHPATLSDEQQKKLDSQMSNAEALLDQARKQLSFEAIGVPATDGPGDNTSYDTRKGREAARDW